MKGAISMHRDLPAINDLPLVATRKVRAKSLLLCDIRHDYSEANKVLHSREPG